MNPAHPWTARVRHFLQEVRSTLYTLRLFSWFETETWSLIAYALRGAWRCLWEGHDLHFPDTDPDGWYVDRLGECLSRSCGRCCFAEHRPLDPNAIEDPDELGRDW